MRLTTEFKAFGREGKSGAAVVDVVVGEVVVLVAVGVVPVVLDMVEAAVLPVGVDNAAPNQVRKERYTEYIRTRTKKTGVINKSQDLPPAAAPALSHGFGGETDAMELRGEEADSTTSHGDCNQSVYRKDSDEISKSRDTS